jgi:hypothetical protein
MFGWFRKYIRKIGIFGVEVEFHPPTDTTMDKPTSDNLGVQKHNPLLLPKFPNKQQPMDDLDDLVRLESEPTGESVPGDRGS